MSWLEQVRTDRPKPPSPPAPFDPARPPASTGLSYAQAALAGEIDRLTNAANGTRNHTLNTAAFRMGQLVAGGTIDQAEVVLALEAAARQIGLTDHEIHPTIRSGLRSGAQHPRDIPDRTPPPGGGEAAPEPELDPEQRTQQVKDLLPRLNWYDLFNSSDEEEWIVEPLLPARRLVALYSPPKVGKSLLMLELAVGVARGEPVLGYTPDRPRRVLYIDFENDPRGDVLQRLIAMGHGPEHLDDLCYLSFPVLGALDCEAGGTQLMDAVEAYGCEVVVIDTVSRAIKGEENENDTWLNFYRHTGKRLKAAGIALVRLDHTGKDETRGQRGGSAKSGDVDAVWRMSRVADGVFQLDCEAHRMPVIEKTLVVHRETSPRLRHRVDAAGRTAAWRAQEELVLKTLDAAGLERDAGRPRAREVLRAAKVQISDGALVEILRRRKESMVVDFGPVRDPAHRWSPEDLFPRSPHSSAQEAPDEK